MCCSPYGNSDRLRTAQVLSKRLKCISSSTVLKIEVIWQRSEMACPMPIRNRTGHMTFLWYIQPVWKRPGGLEAKSGIGSDWPVCGHVGSVIHVGWSVLSVWAIGSVCSVSPLSLHGVFDLLSRPYVATLACLLHSWPSKIQRESFSNSFIPFRTVFRNRFDASPGGR